MKALLIRRLLTGRSIFGLLVTMCLIYLLGASSTVQGVLAEESPPQGVDNSTPQQHKELPPKQAQGPPLQGSILDLTAKADTYMAQSQYDLAIDELEKARAIAPEDPLVLFKLGVAYYESGSPQEAKRHLWKAKSLGFDASDLHIYLAMVHARLGEMPFATKERDWLEKKGIFSARIYLEFGNAYYNVYEKYDRAVPSQAIKEYEKAVALDPNLSDAHMYMGLALFELGKLSEAARSLETALALGRDDARIHSTLGIIYKGQGRWDEAIHELNLSLTRNPNEANLIALGDLYMAKKDFANAVSSYRRVTELLPAYSVGHLKLGQAYYGKRDFDKAISSLKRSLEISPYSPYAYYYLGLAYHAKGDFRAAVEAYKGAIGRYPGYVTAILALGKAEEALGEIDEAMRSYEQAIAIAPLTAEAHFRLGMLYKAKGVKEKAIEKLRRCLHIDDRYPGAREALDALLGR